MNEKIERERERERGGGRERDRERERERGERDIHKDRDIYMTTEKYTVSQLVCKFNVPVQYKLHMAPLS